MKVGDALGVRQFPVRLADLVRYAGAGGDFNPIHWNQRVARSVGLPDVIAHGMFTMALAGRYVTDWAGDPGAVETFDVRFTAPVVVPDDEVGAVVEVSGTVGEVFGDGRVAVELHAECNGVAVLKGARAVVRVGAAG
jgi:acyl dehydratase